MVGKIKRVRQKLHHEAVKLTQETGERSCNSSRESVKLPQPGGLLILKPPLVNTYTLKHVDTEETIEKLSGEDPVKRWNVRSSSIFAETKISPEALVQSLDLDATRSPVPIQKGPGEKKLSKKEKVKQRREKWLNKIDTIKLDREKQKALAKRKATPVVGDMQALADALPDLSELLAASKIRSLKKLKPIVKKKPEPKEFSKMKHTQKRKFIDAEMSRFAEAISNSEFKSNPLAAIGEHLQKRLKEEEEESPS
ncbi:ribosome biogenesis protein SLX9 homolog isoform X2 [Acipenser ruthenus]|uniref:ribosome biogenesis protein SLX9 homolog isoform X2 n=1 Tax=Acipenser ruthenus TaxID=7906 RepID=UPI002742076B|nr:ribosome biogenesis protein SLX9 homolog isoform X2 [Acipenser ruthenus]